MSNEWIREIKDVQAELGCTYKEAMIEASARRKQTVNGGSSAMQPKMNEQLQTLIGDYIMMGWVPYSKKASVLIKELDLKNSDKVRMMLQVTGYRDDRIWVTIPLKAFFDEMKVFTMQPNGHYVMNTKDPKPFIKYLRDHNIIVKR